MSDQTPQQPEWGPPTGPPPQQSGSAPQPPPAPQKKRSGAFKAGFLGCFGVLAAVVVVIIVVAVIASSGSKTNTPTPNASESGSVTTAPATAASSGGKPAGTVLLSITGSGTRTTKKFSAAGDWDLRWSYDCSSFGSEGNFIVSANSSDAMAAASINGVNQLGRSGKGTEHYHQGGTFWLEVNSECSWSVKASVA